MWSHGVCCDMQKYNKILVILAPDIKKQYQTTWNNMVTLVPWGPVWSICRCGFHQGGVWSICLHEKKTRFVSKWQIMKTQNSVKMFQDGWWCCLAAFPDAVLGKMWIFFTCRTLQTVHNGATCCRMGLTWARYHVISYLITIQNKCFRRIQRTFVDDRRWPRFILIVTRSDDISCVTTKCKLDTVTSLKYWQNI